MIDLHYNFPLLGSQVEQWNERLLRAVEENRAGGLRALQPSFKGAADAQRAVAAEWLREPLEQVWLTSGGHHGCMIALFAAELAGKSIAVEEFTYAGFKDQARLTRTRLVPCRTDAQGMIPESLREVCERERREGTPLSAMFTMPTVHNPLSCTMPLERREKVAEIAREFDLLIIEDDAYAYLDEAAPTTLRKLAPERTFYVYGLAKSLAPAARTGFLAAPERFAGVIPGIIRQTSTGVSHLLSAAACSMVKDGSFTALLAAKREEGRRRNAEGRRVLGDACAPGVPTCWHLWVELPDGVMSQQFEKQMSEAGVLVGGGHWSAADFGLPQCIRVSLGGETEWERIMEGLRILKEQMKELSAGV